MLSLTGFMVCDILSLFLASFQWEMQCHSMKTPLFFLMSCSACRSYMFSSIWNSVGTFLICSGARLFFIFVSTPEKVDHLMKHWRPLCVADHPWHLCRHRQWAFAKLSQLLCFGKTSYFQKTMALIILVLIKPGINKSSSWNPHRSIAICGHCLLIHAFSFFC